MRSAFVSHVLGAVVSVAGAFAPLTAAEPVANAIPGIGPAGPIVKVAGDFKFTEGPAADGKGNLYFTDVQGDTIFLLDAAGKVAPFLTPSKHANGLMLNAAGELVACQMEGNLVAINTATKEARVLADNYAGTRFNAPNDLVIDRSGGIYFTDPQFRAPTPLPQGKTAVYYLTADGNITRLIDNLPNPNGVILSPDEATLYVFPSGQKDMLSYAVTAPGKLGEGKVFCTLAQPAPQGNGGGDGCEVDRQGNVYVAAATGIQVFSPAGKPLGNIVFPEQPANVAFGGKDLKTLYVTARTSLYACPMEATGYLFPGKK